MSLSGLDFRVTVTLRKQSRNSKDEPGGRNWRKDHGGCCWPAYFPCLTQLAFLTQPKTICSGLPLPTVSWDLPYQSLSKIPHRLAYKANWWRHFSIEASSSQMTLAGVKLTKLTIMVSFIPLGVKKNCLYNISSFYLKESHIILDPLL